MAGVYAWTAIAVAGISGGGGCAVAVGFGGGEFVGSVVSRWAGWDDFAVGGDLFGGESGEMGEWGNGGIFGEKVAGIADSVYVGGD